MIIPGKRCPYCKGQVTAFETMVRDRHSETGWSWAPVRRTFRSPYPISPSDRKVSRIVQTGNHSGEAIVEYEHVWAGYCKPCGAGLSDEELEDDMQTPCKTGGSQAVAGKARIAPLPARTPQLTAQQTDNH